MTQGWPPPGPYKGPSRTAKIIATVVAALAALSGLAVVALMIFLAVAMVSMGNGK